MGRTFFTMLMDVDLHRELKLMAVQNGVSMRCLIEEGIGIVLGAEKKRSETTRKIDA